jgi:hypothetical protein
MMDSSVLASAALRGEQGPRLVRLSAQSYDTVMIFVSKSQLPEHRFSATTSQVRFYPEFMEVPVNWRQKMAPLGAVFGVPSTVP